MYGCGVFRRNEAGTNLSGVGVRVGLECVLLFFWKLCTMSFLVVALLAATDDDI